MASYIQSGKSKLWSVRFRIIENGRTVQKRLSGFQLKREAEAAYRNFMANYIPPNQSDSADITLQQLFSAYCEYAKARVKESTLYELNIAYKNHIAPFFAEKKITEITKKDILAWQNTLNNKGYKFKTKTKFRGFLSSLFNFAIRYYDLPGNPVLQVEAFRRTERAREMLIWTEDEFNRFYSCIDNITYKTFFLFLYLTGCRKGEALACTWKDINDGYLSIDKNLTRKIVGQPFAITTTKNDSSTRKILLPQKLIDQLATYRIQFDFKDTDFIFAGAYPLAENTITRKLKFYAQKAAVKIIRIHDFRHSHASLLISMGANVLLIARRLGHKDVSQTLNTYSHLMPNDEPNMVAKLNNSLNFI